jgi:UDP-2,4-diacetamido-2,4,6-trideoxy-beta-L-altropyranose hydrolase
LRQDFLSQLDTKNDIPRIASKILVTLGGGDDKYQTLRVIRALQALKVEGLEAVVVVGAANLHSSALESETDQSKFPIRLTYNADNMRELMERADLAVCAGGTTCWELAFMGVPMLVIILADNQQANAEALETEGVAVNLGWYPSLSRDKIAQKLIEIARSAQIRAQMSRRGHFLVDGKGIERVLAELAAK